MITKLVSGGQSGADIAALGVALRHGFPHRGSEPKFRRSLEGPIPASYQLVEPQSDSYIQRTGWNVRDKDGTIVFTLVSVATGGSLKAIGFVKKLSKPCLCFSHSGDGSFSEAVQLEGFVEKRGIRMLNVAGSRKPTEPGILIGVIENLKKSLSLGKLHKISARANNYS